VTNTGGQAIQGPVHLGVDGLSRGARLSSAGAPSANGLGPGESATFSIRFTVARGKSVSYNAHVLAG